ncbi:hypothetical protein C0992_002221 [Termitomyces sp. T32_za158]|nr:hypothetical protein C0992_002221 [Termitomyces sp. T32_za158]
MSNLQKSKYLSVKTEFKKLKTRFSFGSRSPSPAPSGDSADDTGSQRMEAISATASNATPASANDDLPCVTGDIPINRAPAGVSSYTGQENSALMSTWLGIQMFLKRFDRVLEGTPLKNPVNAVNILIDLGNAIVDNKDALQELFSQTRSRLEVVNSALMEIEEEDTKFRLKTEAFAQ